MRDDSERRHQAVERGRTIHRKLARILDLYEEGHSDAEIAVDIGWSRVTVCRYRQVLQLALGTDSGGRWIAR